jgi:putative membrane protein
VSVVVNQSKKQGDTKLDQTRLALSRTFLAYDRTLMAWIRTATSLISFGFSIYKFFQYLGDHGEFTPKHAFLGPKNFAILLISLGNSALLLAAIQYIWARSVLTRMYQETHYSLVAIFAFLTFLFGIFVLIAVCVGF